MSIYPLASPSWDQAEFDALSRVKDSGMFTMGQHTARFEQQFARYVGSKYCVMVNSGSSANLIMVAALFYRESRRLKRGDEAIVPAVSWGTTYYPLHQYGLRLKFVDVDIETLNYDLNALKHAISPETRVVMAVNLLGNPNDFDRIMQLLKGKDIVLLEDNCESMGATFKGRQAGTFGLMGSFSMFFSHHISTMEGGVVVTDDEELYHILLCLRAHGWTRNLPNPNRVCAFKSSDPFEEFFRFVLPGYNVRPLELSAAVGVEQLKKLPNFVRVRRENARRFLKLMANHPHFITQREVGESSWFGFSLVVKPDAPFSRRQVLQKLAEHGIEYRPIVAGNLVRHEVVRWFDYSIHGELRNADLIHRNGFFVGNHNYPLERELEALDSALRAVAG